MRTIIIDGYNVIRADPSLQRFEAFGLEEARTVLVQSLASAPRLVRDQIYVVFDGTRGRRTHVHGHRRGRVNVLYSAQGQTADELIVTQTRALLARGPVVVVSNDVAVRESCRAEGAQVSGTQNLLDQLPGGRRNTVRLQPDEIEEPVPTLSTAKRGNPRRAGRKARRSQEPRF